MIGIPEAGCSVIPGTVASKACSACPAWLCCMSHEGEKWARKCPTCKDIILYRATDHDAKTGAATIRRIWGIPTGCPLYQKELKLGGTALTFCWLCSNSDPSSEGVHG